MTFGFVILLVFCIKICLRHQSVTSFLSGAPPQEKSWTHPWLCRAVFGDEFWPSFPRNSKRKASPKQSHSAVPHNNDPVSRSTRKNEVSLRKQPTFRGATIAFPWKWRLRFERRNSILMTRHCFWLGVANAQPPRSTSQIWVVTRHQYGISLLRRHFAGKPAVASRNFGCFLRLKRSSKWLQSTFSFYCWSFSFSLRHFLCLYKAGTMCDGISDGGPFQGELTTCM